MSLAFNLAQWKQGVDRFKNVGLEPYIADGTVLGHYLINGPDCASCWGGQKIPASTLEEMARYSKSIWPAMSTGAGAAPTWTPKAQYVYLDFAMAQWEGPLHSPSNRLTPEQFRDQETAAAKERGLRLMFGLKYLDGGDGSSKIGGTFANATSRVVNRWAMSPAAVMRVGAVLAAEPYACGFLSWKSNPAYDARPGIMEAKRFVANIATSRASASCVR